MVSEKTIQQIEADIRAHDMAIHHHHDEWDRLRQERFQLYKEHWKLTGEYQIGDILKNQKGQRCKIHRINYAPPGYQPNMTGLLINKDGTVGRREIKIYFNWDKWEKVKS